MNGRNRAGWSRDYDRRRYGRRDHREDVIAVALTAQIVACVALVLVIYLIKKNNEGLYRQMKWDYDVMVTDTGQNQQVLARMGEARNAVSTLFANLEGWLDNRFGLPVQANPQENREPAENGAEHNFNYLSDPSASLLEGGQGGWFPVYDSGDGKLQVPDGMALNPVYLSSTVRPPLSGRVTSLFSYREHPITGVDDFHTGLDIAAPGGSAICAALPGEVEEVGQSAIYGNYIVLLHEENLKTTYSHCSEILAEEGTILRQGEIIARVGQTGVATGPHLHFSVIVDSVYVDPYWVLKDNIQVVEL